MTTRTSSNPSQAASRNPAEDDRLAESSEHSPNSLGSFDHVDHVADTDLAPATETSPDVKTVTEDVDSDAEEAASNLSERDKGLTDDDAFSFGGADEFGPPNLDDFLLLAEGTCRAPTQVTARDALSKVPCVCGRPAPDCRIAVAIRPTVSRDASGIRRDSIPEWMPTKVLEDMARQEVHTTQPKRLTPYVKRKRRISKISSQDKAPTLRMKFPRSMNQPKTPRSVLGEPPLWVGHLPAELEVPLS
jgi:hypothetical protein